MKGTFGMENICILISVPVLFWNWNHGFSYVVFSIRKFPGMITFCGGFSEILEGFSVEKPLLGVFSCYILALN